jgi:hypothetical protein
MTIDRVAVRARWLAITSIVMLAYLQGAAATVTVK